MLDNLCKTSTDVLDERPEVKEIISLHVNSKCFMGQMFLPLGYFGPII